MGCRGWSWHDVAPLFTRIENFVDGDGSNGRGTAGPLKVSTVPDQNPLYDALFAASKAAGFKLNPDYNSEDQEGVVKTQTSIHKGRRMSVAHCYIEPAMKRSANLHVVTDAFTLRLLLEGKRCVGVEYEKDGKVVEAGARDHPVGGWRGQSADPGTVGHRPARAPEAARHRGEARAARRRREFPRPHQRPHHLESEGRARLLQSHGARRRRRHPDDEVPGDRRRLHEPALGAPARLPQDAARARHARRADASGALLHQGSQDAQAAGLPVDDDRLLPAPPESLGSIHIRSGDPKAQPAIRFNFLADPIDQAAMVGGFRMMRKIVDAGPMDAYRGEEFSPGPSVSDEQILTWIRNNSQTAYHPIGTCRMGPAGPTTVVDDKLKVHGLEGLRVADASIFPTMPSGNTNAPSIMVGEKMADILKAA
jgi:choline dehydrogenase